MQVYFRYAILLLLATSAVACTNAQPEFSALAGIPQPLYFGKTNHTIAIVSPTVDIPVQGTCDVRADSIEFRIQGFHNWGAASNFASGAVVDNCKTSGTFSFDLRSLNAMAVWNVTQTVRFTLEAKAVYSVGESEISQLKIEYVIPVGTAPGQFRMSQGAGAASSPSYRARASINFLNGATASSTNFTINRQQR